MPVAPVSASISHKFGEPRPTKKKPRRKHSGVDYDVGKGTPVKASASGVVVAATYLNPKEDIVTVKKGNKLKKEKKFTGSYGNVVVIYHGQDIKTLKHIYTLYAHLDKKSVRGTEEVRQGQVIGTSGRSGTKQEFYNHKGGEELHFEVIRAPRELKWADITLLYVDKEFYRIDPEKFLRSSTGGFVVKIDGRYGANLGDTTTITDTGHRYEHRDSSGKLLHVANKGERPPITFTEDDLMFFIKWLGNIVSLRWIEKALPPFVTPKAFPKQFPFLDTSSAEAAELPASPGGDLSGFKRK